MRRRIAALIALLLAALMLLGGCSEVLQTVTEALPEATEALPLAEAPAEEEQAAEASALITPTKTPRPTKTPKPTKAPTEAPTEEPGPIIEPQAIADYIFAHGTLPDNFITKKEAQALGWDSRYNYVSDVAPGKSIGGDYYGNYEGTLPKKKGRTFTECDCNYRGGKRGRERIVFSNDGHVWYSNDHYETFTELFPSK